MSATPRDKISVERLLQRSPFPVDEEGIEAVRQRLFERAKRLAPPNYEVHEEIGHGQYGRVFRATDTNFPRQVALKVIPYRGERALSRLEREAQALANLDHPNIVKVFEKGIADAGRYFLAMELVDGVRLDHWVRDSPRSWKEIVEIYAQAADALHHVHQRDMIHRDFKPSNAMVGKDSRLRLLDFGLVKMTPSGEHPRPADEDDDVVPMSDVEDSGSGGLEPIPSWSKSQGEAPTQSHGADNFDDLTRSGHIVGTLAYASPEQLQGKAIGPHSDQFSLCVALFDAVHGQRPFTGRTVMELLDQIATGNIARGSKKRRVPRGLRKVIRRGLADKPEDRYDNLAELSTALRRFLRPRFGPWTAMLVGVGLTTAVGGGLYQLNKRPPLSLHWDGAWPERVERADVESRYGPELLARLDAYADAWKSARDSYAERSKRDDDGPQVQCLAEGREQFTRFATALGKGAASSDPVGPSFTAQRIVLADLFDPSDCISATPPQEQDQSIALRLIDAQIARLENDYAQARKILDELDEDPTMGHVDLRAGLFHYERAMVQFHDREEEAWYTLLDAQTSNDGDLRFVIDAMIARLQVGVVLRSVTPKEIEALSTQIERKVAALEGDPDNAAVATGLAPWLKLAHAYSSSRSGRDDEAAALFAAARTAFDRLPPSPLRNAMTAHCILNEAYARASHELRVELDPAPLFDAVESFGEVYGWRHRHTLRHMTKAARVVGEGGKAKEAYEWLAPQLKTFESADEFDRMWLRADILTLDLRRHLQREMKRTTEKTDEWRREVSQILEWLDDTPVGPGRHEDAFHIRGTLASIQLFLGDTNAARHNVMQMDGLAATPREDAIVDSLMKSLPTEADDKKIEKNQPL
ncbi:MAG: protein kinase [Myxococcota bacterium]